LQESHAQLFWFILEVAQTPYFQGFAPLLLVQMLVFHFSKNPLKPLILLGLRHGDEENRRLP
jgi:hypothetical protein